VGKDHSQIPKLNLWTEPWIGVQKEGGGIETLGIRQVLMKAQVYKELYEISPLVVIGIHRLLTAILQYVFEPKSASNITQLWKLKQIPPEILDRFEKQFLERFDLYSEKAPFFQSADIPLIPQKGANLKSIAYLAPEFPSGTQHTHYRHGNENEQFFCSRCIAGGLVALPAFATSGGSGIRPSINGVPPFYVLPGGENLLETLLLSLVEPAYQPEVRDRRQDLVWWRRDPITPQHAEVREVGYLHSLTFTPRRVRVYPESAVKLCTRCGQQSEWGARQMIFDMGESRPKDTAFWRDPFAAYYNSKKNLPIPVRPQEGKAAWRQYGSLFLKLKGSQDGQQMRPRVLDQIADISFGSRTHLPVRCIGLRTDMKAKIFEWQDTGFDLPVNVLTDMDKAELIRNGLEFANQCEKAIYRAFQVSFNKSSKRKSRYKKLAMDLQTHFWNSLAISFRDWVEIIASRSDQNRLEAGWIDQVIHIGHREFTTTVNSLPDDAATLREKVQGEQACVAFLFNLKRKELEKDAN
jgi:CRISPR system Cascade subunit CasA